MYDKKLKRHFTQKRKETAQVNCDELINTQEKELAVMNLLKHKRKN